MWLVGLDGLAYGLVLFLVAAGLSVALGTARVLNLAHGATFAAGAYLAWWASDGTWAGLALALGLALVAGAAFGVVQAVLLAAAGDPMRQALAGLGVALLATAGLTGLFGAAPLSVDPPQPIAGSIELAGRAYPSYRLLLIAVAAGLAGLLWWALARTRAGAIARAAGSDPDALAILGINPTPVRVTTVAGGSALAMIAGVLAAPLLSPDPGLAGQVLLLSLVVVIAGGPGSVPGTLVVALLLGQVQTTAVLAWPTLAPYLVYAVLAAALVARGALALRRAGLS